jgi:hypothetical protein
MASGVPFEMVIPPNALSVPTTITVTELAVPPPAGFADWSPLYRIDPVDLVLAVPATLTVPFSNDCCVGNAGPHVVLLPEHGPLLVRAEYMRACATRR